MIFLSYRRSDTAGHAGRLFDRIAARFGRDQIFMDVDTLRPGEDFTHEIARQIGHCKVLIALIGDQWASATNAQGIRRLEDPADYVRAEIAAALKRGVPVIPVLVEGACMPSAEQLPEVIRDLARLQALEISEGRFDREAQELLDAIAGRLSGRARRGPANRNLLLGAIALVTVAMLVAGWWSQRASSPRSELVGRWVAEVDDPEAGPFNLLFDLQTVGDRVLGSVSFPTGVGGSALARW
jgi:hypothetical protein